MRVYMRRRLCWTVVVPGKTTFTRLAYVTVRHVTVLRYVSILCNTICYHSSAILKRLIVSIANMDTCRWHMHVGLHTMCLRHWHDSFS